MADNCSVLDPWTVQYPYPAGVAEAVFARENDALARALRISLISDPAASAAAAGAPGPSPESSSSFLFSPPGGPFRRRNPAAGRVAKKRKSRASKRSPTTYITADPANFRELVQRVTGTSSPDAAGLALETTALPPPAAVAERTRRLLPTLDTSAFFCDGETGFVGSIGAPTADGLIMANFDPFCLVPSYPTLDSWGAL